MLIPDVNVLLYAHIGTFVQHTRARAWWEAQLSGHEQVGVAHVCALGFVRLATNRRIFAEPLSVAHAVGLVRSWLAQPNARVLLPSEQQLNATFDLLQGAGAAGNLTTDAQIAALALENRGVVATVDGDFARFPNVKVVNPLTS